MSKHRIKQAVKLFRNDLAKRSTRRHNARQWLAMTQWLGDKWLAIPQAKEQA